MDRSMRQIRSSSGVVLTSILLLLLTVNVNAQAVNITDDQMQEYFAGCAATQSLVTIKMDSSLKELILADARWFAERVEDKTRIEKTMRAFKDGYNDGNITWRELVDMAENCSEAKRLMLSSE